MIARHGVVPGASHLLGELCKALTCVGSHLQMLGAHRAQLGAQVRQRVAQLVHLLGTVLRSPLVLDAASQQFVLAQLILLLQLLAVGEALCVTQLLLELAALFRALVEQLLLLLEQVLQIADLGAQRAVVRSLFGACGLHGSQFGAQCRQLTGGALQVFLLLGAAPLTLQQALAQSFHLSESAALQFSLLGGALVGGGQPLLPQVQLGLGTLQSALDGLLLADGLLLLLSGALQTALEGAVVTLQLLHLSRIFSTGGARCTVLLAGLAVRPPDAVLHCLEKGGGLRQPALLGVLEGGAVLVIDNTVVGTVFEQKLETLHAVGVGRVEKWRAPRGIACVHLHVLLHEQFGKAQVVLVDSPVQWRKTGVIGALQVRTVADQQSGGDTVAGERRQVNGTRTLLVLTLNVGLCVQQGTLDAHMTAHHCFVQRARVFIVGDLCICLMIQEEFHTLQMSL
mmetsp:Transcript_36936/g.92590  ORF Transcript_36936/g.92590 Transcript_36936/m.92590 type:complete len:454 (+) Transcript_36936:1295-2656(+)